MNIEVLKSILPMGLLNSFNIVDFKELGDIKTKKDSFFIYLDEKYIFPSNYNQEEHESKGFNNRFLIQYLPIKR